MRRIASSVNISSISYSVKACGVQALAFASALVWSTVTMAQVAVTKQAIPQFDQEQVRDFEFELREFRNFTFPKLLHDPSSANEELLSNIIISVNEPAKVPIGTDEIVQSPIPLAIGQFRQPFRFGPCATSMWRYARIQDQVQLDPAQLQTARFFIRDCYQNPRSVGDGDKGLDQASAQDVLARTVLLKYSTVSISHCTGFYLGNGQIMTAAHCASDRTHSPNSELIKPVSDCTDLEIMSSDNRAISISTIRYHQSIQPIGDCSAVPFPKGRAVTDIAIITVDASSFPALGLYSNKQIQPINVGSPLVVYGRSPTHSTDEISIVRLRSEACRSMAPIGDEGRFKTQCLALPGMSGSPIFTEDSDGVLRLAGIHQSALVDPDTGKCIDIYDWCGSSDEELKFLNLGYRISFNAEEEW